MRESPKWPVFLVLIGLLLNPIMAQSVVSHVPLVAVSSDGMGMMCGLEVEITDGKGRVLFNTEPLIGVNTQNSERTAVAVAEAITEYNLSKKDVIFTIHANASIVDGASAGAAMVLSVISAITGKRPAPDVMMTGTINPDGTIGQVGGLIKKAKVAADNGARLFLIPAGQTKETEYVEVVDDSIAGIQIQTIKPVVMDVVEYSKENWNLDVKEVGTINDITKYALADFAGEMPIEEVNVTELATFGPSPSDEPLKHVAERAILRLRGLNSTLSLVKAINESEQLVSDGYFYSAANTAFLASVGARAAAFDVGTLKQMVADKLASVRENVNLTEYHSDDLQIIASAQQRYVRASIASESNDSFDLSAAFEWSSAAEDIISKVGNNGRLLEPSFFDEKVQQEIEDAKKSVETASALGVDIGEAEQFLVQAIKAKELGFPFAAIYDAVDASALASSKSFAGTLSSTINYAENMLSNEPHSPWGVAYQRHGKYLVYLSRKERSKSLAEDAMYLALRADGVENAFAVIPAKKSVAENVVEKTPELVPIFLFLIALLLMYENTLIARKFNSLEQRMTMVIGRVNTLYAMAAKRPARRRR